MFTRDRAYKHTVGRTSLFFKLWFVFCAILSLAIVALGIFSIYTVVSDPAMIGRFVAEIQNGYTSTVYPQPGEISQ